MSVMPSPESRTTSVGGISDSEKACDSSVRNAVFPSKLTAALMPPNTLGGSDTMRLNDALTTHAWTSTKLYDARDCMPSPPRSSTPTQPSVSDALTSRNVMLANARFNTVVTGLPV